MQTTTGTLMDLDFLKLQRTLGKTQSAAADSDGDRMVTGLDFLSWQRNVSSVQPPLVTSVPEPSSLMLLTLGVLMWGKRRR